MVVNIQFTPLYGAHTSELAVSHLLTIDGFNILLDCGWTSFFDPVYLKNLAKVAPSIHVVLLSHPDIAHLGALPYAVANLGLTAPVFSTLPVWRMGQMSMYDAFLSQDAQAPFQVFNLDHVDAAFEIASSQPDTAPRYHLLKYQQHFPLDDLPHPGTGIVITPHGAGHMLGGTVWNIKKDTESLVYAVDFNHRRERHLNPTTLSSFSRPSHLIIAAARAETTTESKKSTEIFSRVKTVVKKHGGNVLIPVDTAGRIIELAVQLHDAWAVDREMNQVPLVILHDLSTRTFEFARSMIEWMSDEVVKRFDVSRENLFIFKHVKLCQSLKALDGLPTPMVVLASSVSMEMGFARQLFAKWCQDPRNAVILADRPEPNTLYAKLFDHCERPMRESDNMHEPTREPLPLSLVLKRKEYLQGEELQHWREQEAIRIAQEQEEERKKVEEIRRAKEEEEKKLQQEEVGTVSDSDVKTVKDSDNSETVKENVNSVAELLKDPERYDEYNYAQLLRLGFITSEESAVISVVEPPRPLWDDYGQIVDTTRFMIGEDPGEGAPERPSDHPQISMNFSEEVDNSEEDIPTKYVEDILNIKVVCQLWHVDNSGLSDGDSIKRIVKEVEPRQVTLIAGTSADTAHLAGYLLSNIFGASGNRSGQEEKADKPSHIVSPHEMETVDITSHASVLEFHLQESLVRQLEWKHVDSAGIAFVDAVVEQSKSEKGLLMLGKRNPISDSFGDSMEVEYPESDEETTNMKVVQSLGHPTIFVGTIMLNRMKEVISAAGMKAEFAGGALCVENPDTGAVVLLKKIGAQQIVIEGALSEEYLNVKDMLYNELVIPT